MLKYSGNYSFKTSTPSKFCTDCGEAITPKNSCGVGRARDRRVCNFCLRAYLPAWGRGVDGSDVEYLLPPQNTLWVNSLQRSFDPLNPPSWARFNGDSWVFSNSENS